MSIISKMFSPKGELNRKEYLIYGLIVPLVIFILGVTIDKGIANEMSKTFGLISFLLAIYVGFVAALKRARETASSTFLTMILWLIVTPLVILYLLIAAPKTGEKQSVNVARVVVLLFAVIIVLGVAGAFVIPKLAKQHDTQAQQTQTLPAPKK